MRPSPFTGKFKRKQIKVDKKEDEQSVEKKSEHDPSSHQPKFSLNKGPKKNKDVKNVYDALKDTDAQHQEGENHEESTNNISLKPNLKLKGGKKLKLGPKTPMFVDQKSEDKNQGDYEQQKESHAVVASKPKLLSKGNIKFGSHREAVRSRERIQEKQQVIVNNDNRYNAEESLEGSVSESQSFSIAPKFKIKKNQQNEAPIIQENAAEQDKGNTYSNFANIQIEHRQINLDQVEHKVSEVKVEKQKKRTNDLNKLLNLEVDLFEQTLNMTAVTPYEIYISKIKSGSLKNSNDQAFDEKTVSFCQTLPLQYEDFVNQCPQDYHTDILNIYSSDPHAQNDEDEAFAKFIQKVSPVIQELIKPSNNIVMPPIFLLGLKPEFVKFMKCPFPVFLYKSEAYNLGIVVIGEKLYITENELNTVISVGNNLIGGTKDGNLILWTGKNNKTCKLYHKIYETIGSTNFQLPEHETNEFDKFSVYRTDASIVDFLDENSESNDTLLSLDQMGRMIKWKIQNVFGRKNQLKPINSVDLGSHLQKQSLIAYSLKKRNDMYFISTSTGIIVWNGDQIHQKLSLDNFQYILDFGLPHRSNLVITVSSDNGVRIYDQSYQKSLLKLEIPSQYILSQPENTNHGSLIIPELSYESKKLSTTAHLYITTVDNQILHYKILTNPNEPQLLNKNKKGSSDKNVIFEGVNVLEGGVLELVALWRDLKCTSEVKKMDCDLTSNVGNVKSILEQNRRVFTLLENSASFRS